MLALMFRYIPLACLGLALLLPTSRAAADDLRLSPYFLVAGGGDVKLDSNRTSEEFEYPANASVGFGVRFEAQVLEFLSIGGLFEYSALQLEGVTLPIIGRIEPDKDKFVDFDLWIKGGTRFSLGPGDLEVYGGVPIGFTIGVIPGGDDREAHPGLNLGILAGAQYFIDRFGVFTDLGYRFHKIFDRQDDERIGARISQLSWQLGGTIVF